MHLESQIELEIQHLIKRAQQQKLSLSVPNETWVGSVQDFRRALGLLFLRKRFSQLGLSNLHSFYTSNFRPPKTEVLEANGTATRLVAQQGGSRLRTIMCEEVRWLQRVLRDQDGVRLGEEAKVVLKGSWGACALFAPDRPDLGNFPRPLFERICNLARDAFAFSDMDIDLLTNPNLPPERFRQVRSTLVRRGIECLSRLKRRLETSGMASGLARSASRAEPTLVPCRRSSFVIQPAFESASPRGVPSRGLRCVSALIPVGAFPGGKRPIRVPRGYCYVSSNELHFLNGSHEVRFTLLRCMLAFRLGGDMAHAELMDISVPHSERSRLRHAWNNAHVKVPDTHIYGDEMMVLAPFQQLKTLLTTMLNALQDHKLRKRSKRALVLLILLLILRGATQPFTELRARALCQGATGEMLKSIPLRKARETAQEEAPDWKKVASECREHMTNGHVYWQ